MDPPLPQRFSGNLGPALQSNPFLPNGASDLKLPRCRFPSRHTRAAPAWVPQCLLKHHLHPQMRPPSAAKQRKCLDVPHIAKSGSPHTKQLYYFKGRVLAFSFHLTASWLQDFPGGEKPGFNVLVTWRRLQTAI